MPSQFSTLLRSMILLVFLLGLPFLAVTGTGPDRLLDALVDWCAERLEARTQHGQQEQASAARHVAPAAELRGSRPEMPDKQSPVPPAGSREDPPTGPSQTGPLAGPGGDATRHGPLMAGPPPTGRVGHAAAVEPPEAASGSCRSEGTAAPDDEVADTVAAIEQRLRQLGASYYLLERWGHRRSLYRFQCRMPLKDDPNHYTQFQAIEDQPLRAMQDVLRRIEAWQSTATASASDPPAMH